MHKMEDFQILDKIHEKDNKIIFHAMQSIEKKNVIIKTFKSEFPTTSDLLNLQHEYEMLKNLDAPGILHAYNLIKSHNTELLVLEDSAGQTLKEYLKENRSLSLVNFFTIAIQLTEIISHIHQHKII